MLLVDFCGTIYCHYVLILDYILSFVNILAKKYIILSMNIGEKIKDLRLYNALTQYELSKKADISRSVLSAYENNIAIPTATAIAKIAVALNVSADYLLGLEDDFGVRTATSAAPIGEGLTSEERELLRLYRGLSPYLQSMTMEAVKSWSKKGSDGAQKKA